VDSPKFTTTYEYTYNGGLLTKLVKNGVTMYFVYDAAGQPYAMIYDGYVLYYILNQQGGCPVRKGDMVIFCCFAEKSRKEKSASLFGTLAPSQSCAV
jgi:hypothetical protein